ncbi:MAG TPA: hypothetical protein VK102_05340 [Sphingobacterium sp.]|nr:hypothetical protein [Sphingobacterium sp.]
MTSKARYIVIGIAVGFLLYALYFQYYTISFYIFGFIGYLVWSHFREGTVFLATQAFHKQDYDRTKNLLLEIKYPDQLRKGRRNYYEFMWGNILLKEGDIDKAEYHFQMASRLPWKREYEKAMVLINLANISLRKKDEERIIAYLDLTDELKLTARQEAIVQKIRKEVKKRKNNDGEIRR